MSAELEPVVLRFTDQLLSDQAALSGILHDHAPGCDLEAACRAAGALGTELQEAAPDRRRAILNALFRKIALSADAITFEVDPGAIARMLVPYTTHPDQHPDRDGTILSMKLPISMKRRGVETRIVMQGNNGSSRPDDSLVELVARAHLCLARLIRQPELSITELGAELGIDRADIGRILPLAFLSPRITEQILTGTQPDHISPMQLARQHLPLLWAEQAQAFG